MRERHDADDMTTARSIAGVYRIVGELYGMPLADIDITFWENFIILSHVPLVKRDEQFYIFIFRGFSIHCHGL